jgi:hypothetical protein
MGTVSITTAARSTRTLTATLDLASLPSMQEFFAIVAQAMAFVTHRVRHQVSYRIPQS